MSYGKINQQIVNGAAYGGANCSSVCVTWCSVDEVLQGGVRVGDSVRMDGVGDVVTDAQGFDVVGFGGSASPIWVTLGGVVVFTAFGVGRIGDSGRSQLYADMVRLSSDKMTVRSSGDVVTSI